MRHIQRLDHGDPAVMQQVQALLRAAHQQEAAQIGSTGQAHAASSGFDVASRIGFGAFDGGELIGVIAVGPDPEPGQLSIDRLFVSAPHQRQGVANELLRTVLASAPGVVFSVQVAQHNEPALALYQASGFQAYRRGELGPTRIPLLKLRRPAP